MNITGKTMIFKSEYGYSIAISNKNQEGTYDKMYVQVQLPKGIELENKTMIEITKGFITFYKTKDGLSKLKIIVMEYNTDEKIDGNDAFELTTDDLPF